MRGRKNRILTIILLIGSLALSACAGIPTSGSSAPTQSATLAGAGSSPVLTAPTQPAAPTTPPVPAAAGSTATGDASTAPAAAPSQDATASSDATASINAAATPTQTGPVPSTGGAQNIPADTVKSFPDPSGYFWAPVVTGLNRPLDMAALPGSTGRMYVVEQTGTIRIVENGKLLPDPLLDITGRVGSQGNEQGLLGIALHPNFAQNGFFYVNYTDLNGNTVIARFQVTQADPNHVNPNSEKILLQVNQPFPNHNGGSMVFGPDGYLYMGLGDGGSEGDPLHNGQSVNTLLGKLLRVDVDHGDPYTIPADNPFAKGGGRPEIWAYGLRNPWRFSFDRLTGDLFIADVGQNLWEEIDYLPAGAAGGTNFGWSYREGLHPYRSTPPANVKLTDPVAEYGHDQGCAVTGGFVYRGQALPEFRGIYLFSDYCSGIVWGLLKGANGTWQMTELFQTHLNPSSFGQDRQGEIYIVDQGSGGLYRLQKK